MPYVTIYVAPRGGRKSNGETSGAGHVWYRIDDGNGNQEYYGFAQNPDFPHQTGVPGEVYHDDDERYVDIEYTRTIEITQQQYDELKEFGDNPYGFGFGTDYDIVNNNCMDFTLTALERAGLVPPGDYFGVIPTHLIPYFDLIGLPLNDPGWSLLPPIPDWLLPGKGRMGQAPDMISPLVLDLDGDGIETTTMGYGDGASTVYFDLNNDGFAQRTGWVTGGDGLLAIDLNGNGKIDNQGELFGNGGAYADGFAALTALDSNADNKITSADVKWSKLRVWVDADGDGVTDSGELKTLGTLGITRINLNDTPLTDTYNNENLVSSTATFVKNGVTRTIADVWFRNDATDTQYTGNVTLNEEVFYLPTLKGFGTLKPLHVAMSQDATLLGMVKDFMLDWTPARFLDNASLNDDVQAILYRWAGVDGVLPESRGVFVDAQVLSFMEKLTGQPFLASNGDTQPTGGNQGNAVTNAYNEAFDAMKAQLIVQSGGYSLFSETPWYNLIAGDLVGGKISAASIAALQTQATSAPDKAAYWQGVAEFLLNVKDLAEFSATEMGALNAAITSTTSGTLTWLEVSANVLSQYETMNITGTDFADHYRGNAQTDTFHGLGGNDILEGAAGADYLYGGTGNDTYVLAPGFVNDLDYHDYIYEEIGQGSDTIKFTGVAASNIRSWHDSTHMYFTIAGDASNSILSVRDDVLASGAQMGQRIERIVFDSGSAWNFADGLEMTDTDDGHSLHGSALADTLDGRGGSDYLSGYAGNDILIGGAGVDVMHGGTGNDTYVFAPGFVNDPYPYGYDAIFENVGEGSDTIKFTGVAASNVRSWHDWNFMYFTIAGDATNSIVYIEDAASYSGAQMGQRIEQIAFDSGPAWNYADGLEMTDTDDGHLLVGSAMADTLDGRGGDDALYGLGGNDTLTGGTGSDSLFGGVGNDTYVFKTGFVNESGAYDYIYEEIGEGSDTIKFTGVSASNVRSWHDAGDMYFSIVGDTSNSILRIQDGVIASGAQMGQRIERIVFDSGIIWNFADGLEMTDTEDSHALYGSAFVDTLDGRGGDDALYGFSGNDVLIGGSGGDQLYGGAGNDTYVFDTMFGMDIISDTGGNDTIKLLGAFSTENISFGSSGSDLEIVSVDGLHEIRVLWQFSDSTSAIETLQFADGFKANLLTQPTWIWGTSAGQTTNGTANADTILGRGGNDTINGNAGNDALHGGSGNDTVRGGNGNDIVHGGIGADSLYGDSGNDTLYGDDGLDNLWGGTGADSFLFLKGTAFKNIDVINDFTKTQADKINISDLLQGYDPATSAITGFVQITTSGTDSILKVDADGGSNNFVQIATIKGVTGLTDEAGLVAGGYLIVA